MLDCTELLFHQNLTHWPCPTASLEQALRAIWGAVSQAAVLILPQIKQLATLMLCISLVDWEYPEIPWTEERGRLQSMGSQRVRHNLTKPPHHHHHHLKCTSLSTHNSISGYYHTAGASQVVLVVENPPVSAGDLIDVSSVLGSGRSPGGGNGNPLRYSCLDKFHRQRSLAGYSPRGLKESDTAECLSTEWLMARTAVVFWLDSCGLLGAWRCRPTEVLLTKPWVTHAPARMHCRLVTGCPPPRPPMPPEASLPTCEPLCLSLNLFKPSYLFFNYFLKWKKLKNFQCKGSCFYESFYESFLGSSQRSVKVKLLKTKTRIKLLLNKTSVKYGDSIIGIDKDFALKSLHKCLLVKSKITQSVMTNLSGESENSWSSRPAHKCTWFTFCNENETMK